MPTPDYEEIRRLEAELGIDDTPADDLIDRIDAELTPDAVKNERLVVDLVVQPTDPIIEALEDELGAHCHGERGDQWAGGILIGKTWSLRAFCAQHDRPGCWRID